MPRCENLYWRNTARVHRPFEVDGEYVGFRSGLSDSAKVGAITARYCTAFEAIMWRNKDCVLRGLFGLLRLFDR